MSRPNVDGEWAFLVIALMWGIAIVVWKIMEAK
jgi:hypothetical protein